MGPFHLTNENLMIEMIEVILEDKQIRSYSLLSIWEMVVSPKN